MREHGGRIFDLPHPEGVLDFSSNINPYGPPPHALRAAARALKRVSVYPDPDQRALKGAFSRWTGLPEEMLVFGNGASELIGATLAGLRPRQVVLPVPTFGEYGAWAERLGIPVLPVPLEESRNFAPSHDALRSALGPRDLLVLCQPNNPTGRAWTREEVTSLLEACAAGGARMLLDECFLHLTWPAAFSPASLPWPAPLTVLRAFTKDFSAPGLRLGALAAPPETARAVREHLQPWPVNTPGEAFAAACAARPEPFLTRSRQLLAAERRTLTRGLEALGFRVLPGAANFLLCRAPLPGGTLAERLRPRDILVRRCGSFGLEDSWIRLGVKDRASNRRLLLALEKVVYADPE